MLSVHRRAAGVVTVRACITAWAGMAASHAMASTGMAMDDGSFMHGSPGAGNGVFRGTHA
jgi:hypothetical protein